MSLELKSVGGEREQVRLKGKRGGEKVSSPQLLSSVFLSSNELLAYFEQSFASPRVSKDAGENGTDCE